MSKKNQTPGAELNRQGTNEGGDDLVRFTICVRKSTLDKMDELAGEQQRSRSKMFDIAGENYYNNLKSVKKSKS